MRIRARSGFHARDDQDSRGPYRIDADGILPGSSRILASRPRRSTTVGRHPKGRR